ncbi:MAG: DUF2723 domain-containing protein [bacterium]
MSQTRPGAVPPPASADAEPQTGPSGAPGPRRPLLGAAAVAAGALLLYLRTAAPDVGLVDSGEFSLVGARGGVPHPPGFPLYRLFAELFAKLPVGSAARGVNLMSTFFAALAAGATFFAAERLLAFVEASAGARRGSRPAPGASARLFAAAAAALAFATSWNPWTWSAVAEVYSLNVFLVASAWACAWGGLVALAAAPAHGGDRPPRRGAANVPPEHALHESEARERAWPWITAASLFASFGLADHHATAALVFPVFLVMLGLARPALLRTSRLWVTTLLSIALSLSLYLTLIFAARRDPGLGWGGTTTLPLLFRHLTGQQYSQQVGAPLQDSLRVARDFAATLFFGCGIPTSLLALGGILSSLLRRASPRAAQAAFLAPLALMLLNLALSTRYIAGPEDRMAYDLPATVAWCLLAALGAHALLRRVAGGGRALLAASLALVPATWNVVRNLPLCDLRRDHTARVFADEMLGRLPKGAVVVTAEWDLAAPYLYLRHVEGWRTDLHVVDILMMRRFWYLDYLERADPDLVAASRREFDTFRDQIRLFDLGRPYDQAHIQEEYDALMTRWVEIGRAGGGAFVDWLCPNLPQETSWISRLPAAPDGLMLRFLAPGDSLRDRPIPPCDAVNLRYVRSRITTASLGGDRESLVPHFDPYWKVWSQYQSAVAAALIVAAREGDEAFEARRREIAAWFPETDYVAARVRAKG